MPPSGIRYGHISSVDGGGGGGGGRSIVVMIVGEINLKYFDK